MPQAQLPSSQRGLTLVEWMVSITIGMFLLIGLTALIGSQSGTRRSIDNTGKLIENGRFAIEQLSRDIQLAGYYGPLSTLPNPPASLPNPCSLDVTVMAAAIPIHIQGYNAPTGSAIPTCVVNHKAGTDIIVVRRAGTGITAVGSATAARVYLQTGLNASKSAFEYRIDAAPSASFTLINNNDTVAALREFLTHIYFVSECSAPTGSGDTCAAGDDGGTWIPTLKRVELTVSEGATALSTTSLVEGIDNLQFDFGLDSVTAPATPVTVADGSPDTYTAGSLQDASEPMTAEAWANVVSVRVHVLARSLEFENGYTDTKTYNMGLSGTTTATNDAFKRHVFTQLVRVVNPSSRRSAL